MEKFQKLEEPYYPKLELEDRNRRAERLPAPAPGSLYNDQPRRYSRFSRSFAFFEFVTFMFAPS